MGTIAVQTQCCLTKKDEEWEDEDGETERTQEANTVQLVKTVP